MKGIFSNQRGAAMVEFVLVAVLLFTIVFGVIEFGLVIKDNLGLSQAVREGVRDAALGDSLLGIKATVTNSTALKITDSDINCYYRTRVASGWPSGWEPGTPINIPTGSTVQVKVSAQYAHKMVTGGWFGSTPITLKSEMVMRYEAI